MATIAIPAPVLERLRPLALQADQARALLQRECELVALTLGVDMDKQPHLDLQAGTVSYTGPDAPTDGEAEPEPIPVPGTDDGPGEISPEGAA